MTLYLSNDLKQSIETQSERNDQSQNEWVRDAIRRKIKSERQESLLESTNAEQRLESIAQSAADEIADATQQYHQLLALSAIYSIAGFRLVGDRDFSDPQRETAIEAAQARLRQPDVPALPEFDSPPQQPDSSRASGSRAQSQQPTPEPRPTDLNDSDEPDDDDESDDLDVNDYLG